MGASHNQRVINKPGKKINQSQSASVRCSIETIQNHRSTPTSNMYKGQRWDGLWRGCSGDVKRQSQSRHKKEREREVDVKKKQKVLDEQHNKKTKNKTITITSRNKTYIPGCIIQIKQLDLVTILLEISFHVGGAGGRRRGRELINRAPKDERKRKSRVKERERNPHSQKKKKRRK